MYDLKMQLVSDHEAFEMNMIKNKIIDSNRNGSTSLKLEGPCYMTSAFRDYLATQGVIVIKRDDYCRLDWSGLFRQDD